MADPTPAPPKITISPSTADVNANAVCQFTVQPTGTQVAWSIQPAIGAIDQNGVYKSPAELKMPQVVIVTATAATTPTQSTTASINLTDTPWRIKFLAGYAIVVALLIGISLLYSWHSLYQCPAPPVVVINPPEVTLDPAADDKFSFAATVIGDPKNAVTWSVDPPTAGDIDSTGTFRRKLVSAQDKDKAKDIDDAVNITAHSLADPTRTGTAVIHLLSGKHLEIAPLTTSVFAAQQSTMMYSTAAAPPPTMYRTAPATPVKWSVSRSDIASISPEGVFTAGMPNQTSVVQVTAWGPSPHEQAAVAVTIATPVQVIGCRTWPVLLFVITCGALGSMLYFTSSFVAYVGNQTFRSSWFWFYISRPFVGGGLAIVFFFVTSTGLLQTSAPANWMWIGLISALVGLFSDKAVKKLSDIVDTLFSTKDERKDKLSDAKNGSGDGGDSGDSGTGGTSTPTTTAPAATTTAPVTTTTKPVTTTTAPSATTTPATTAPLTTAPAPPNPAKTQ